MQQPMRSLYQPFKILGSVGLNACLASWHSVIVPSFVSFVSFVAS